MTGLTANAGGNVSYVVYTNDTCAGGGTDIDLGPVTVTNGATDGSVLWLPLATGTYYVVASYSGDSNNGGLRSDCAGGEVVVT